jgi:putative sigma-54 modulation protein
MEITITGKGIEITPALRSYTESKLKKLNRLISSAMDVHATLSVQRYLQIVDLSIKTRNGGFSARGQTTDMYASINEAVDNLLKQARRQSRRIKSHKGRRRPERAEVMEELVVAEEETAEEGQEPNTVIRERVSVKPLSLEEAILQMRAADGEFLVFRNAANSELNIVYRRKDGSFGLIEPKA